MKVADNHQMQCLDKLTIEKYGIPGCVLMENAGRGFFELLKKGLKKEASVLILCGKGNNGGDGFVIARYLLNSQYKVKTFLFGEKKSLKGDAALNCSILEKTGAEITEIFLDQKLSLFQKFLRKADFVIDALFGTGLKNDLDGWFIKIIEMVNEEKAVRGFRLFSCDTPSGLGSDGSIMGAGIKADKTITFGLPKVSFYDGEGPCLCGEIEVVDIGIPIAAKDEIKFKLELITRENVPKIKKRKIDGHKGSFGHTLIVGGSKGKIGCVKMAGMSALRTGCGLVTCFVPENIMNPVESDAMELMFEPMKISDGFLSEISAESVIEALKGKSVLVVGPGLPINSGSLGFLEKLLKVVEIPVVLDAEMINLLGMKPELLLKRKCNNLVLTPHPGEMARLTGTTSALVQKKRVETASVFAQKYSVDIILKGYGTVIASKKGESFINTTGNPGMAKAGMGDLLCGFLAGFLNRTESFLEGLRAAVFFHGFCGDIAKLQLGEESIVSTDLLKALPKAYRLIYPENQN